MKNDKNYPYKAVYDRNTKRRIHESMDCLQIASGNKGVLLMSNPIKYILDKEPLIKDIAERENIICKATKSLFTMTHTLYRMM